jgi:hypothetical protein
VFSVDGAALAFGLGRGRGGWCWITHGFSSMLVVEC